LRDNLNLDKKQLKNLSLKEFDPSSG